LRDCDLSVHRLPERAISLRIFGVASGTPQPRIDGDKNNPSRQTHREGWAMVELRHTDKAETGQCERKRSKAKGCERVMWATTGIPIDGTDIGIFTKIVSE
jgi:hypothetical protein